MIPFLNLSAADKEAALLAAEEASPYKLPAYIIEKDFWVTVTLKVLYKGLAPTFAELSKQPFIFKGGTSLSKCYQLINRMSEDIDLSFSLELLQCEEVKLTDEAGRKALLTEALKIDSTAEAFIIDQLVDPLRERLQEFDSEITVTVESEAPLNIGIYYPKALSSQHYSGAVQPRVLLETGGRSDNNPTEVALISHMLGDCIDELKEDTFEVVALAPQRTMLEKMFGVHTNLTQQKTLPKYARHLYDIIRLDDANEDWHTNKKLFLEHVDFSDANYKTHKASCTAAHTGPLKLVPDTEQMDLHYREDWESMSDMFPRSELPYSYEELIKLMGTIELKVNQAYYS